MEKLTNAEIKARADGNATCVVEFLTKREYFAGLFMAQIIAGEGARMVATRDARYDETNWKEVCAANAIEFADALLKALAR